MKKDIRPNILIITSDQQRKDSLWSYNKKIIKGSVDYLAEDGVIFDRSYICHPTCTPSRASILTGQMGSVHGAYTIGTALSQNSPMFSKILTENNYETYFIGKPHFQQLSTPGSMEYFGNGRNIEFFKKWHGPYYGFNNCEIYNGHTSYNLTAGMHYYVWLKEHGLTDEQIDNYFNYKPSDSFREHGEWKIPLQYHPDVFTSEKSINYIKNHDRKKPFAMWISFSDPHDPHVVPKPYCNMYSPYEVDYKPYIDGEHDTRPDCYNQLYHKGLESLPFNDGIGVPSAPTAKTFGNEKYFREITAVHHGMVALIENEIQKIIDCLKLYGLYNNTLIIYTTDHGDYLGNHGYVYKGFPAFEEVYNVPFIIKNPYQINKGTRTDSLISHIDIAPTILDFAGIAKPDTIQGISEKQVFCGEKSEIRNEVFIENRPVQKAFYQKMIVDNKYKLVTYMDSTQGELYNLKDDKDQYNNLWNNPLYQDIKHNLLLKIIIEYNKKADINYLNKTDIKTLLYIISDVMHKEEPVQIRTSYS